MSDKIQVAAYYFPEYHPDARNDGWHGHGWTEWELMKAAKPRFEGHRQPIVPEWGYFDESDPEWAAKEIDLAADNGIDCFIYDWYWYEDGPFLEGGLEKGFLRASNRNRINFALMWANHDWWNIHPAKFLNPPEVIASARVSRSTFDKFVDYIIENYFSQPNYWKIDGEPYFSIYELETFIVGVGGLDQAKEAIERFRRKTIEAGFPGLHLNAIHRGVAILQSEVVLPNFEEITNILGCSSIGCYTWIHHRSPNKDGFPRGNYIKARDHNYGVWEEHTKQFGIPYHPNVSMGWDPSPRTVQTDVFEQRGYPWTAVWMGNTPEAFKEALERVKEFVLHPEVKQKIVTINAWNEWTEGSYLLPDTDYGAAFVQAVGEVFG